MIVPMTNIVCSAPKKELKPVEKRVGTTGFEPATTRPPDVYSTELSYVPMEVLRDTPKPIIA
jgi:hypothetical protein